MTIELFVFVALANCAVLEAWFKGSIFASPRAYLEELSGLLPKLLTCLLCLSYHTPWLSVLGLYLADMYDDTFIMAVIYSLAMTFTVNGLIKHFGTNT